jgi:hypothetical protein
MPGEGNLLRLQQIRLADLLAELDREHGLVDPLVLEAVRQKWPTPKERVVKRRGD